MNLLTGIAGEIMKKDKNIMGLCMKYSNTCKLCPRYKKCNEELDRGIDYVESYKKKHKRIKKNKKRFNSSKHKRSEKY